MRKNEMLRKEWRTCYDSLLNTEFFAGMTNGTLSLMHYIGFLRETYHNVSHNPKKMALFQAHIRTDRHGLESKLLKHAAMEIGHDQLALDDLRALGVNTDLLSTSRPLPSTEAFTGFVVFQIQHRNPLAYLGYLYHLEALPTHMGTSAGDALKKMGVPENAMTFLSEHAEADLVHMQWNEDYIEGFVKTDSDLEALLYGLRSSCELHGIMFQGIMDHVRHSLPKELLIK